MAQGNASQPGGPKGPADFSATVSEALWLRILLRIAAGLHMIGVDQSFNYMEGLLAQNEFLSSAHPCNFNRM